MLQIDHYQILDTCNKHGLGIKSVVAIEECSELIKALTKFLKTDGALEATPESMTDEQMNCRIDIIEETADVLLSIEHIRYIYGISDDDLNEWLRYKQTRQAKRDWNFKDGPKENDSLSIKLSDSEKRFYESISKD